MSPQLADRFPQIGFGFSTEYLDGFALLARIGVDEAEASAPGTVVSPPDDEAEVNHLAGTANGIEFVLNGLPGIPGRGAHRGL